MARIFLVLLLAGCSVQVAEPQRPIACYAGAVEGDHGERELCREELGSDRAWCRRLDPSSIEGVCTQACDSDYECGPNRRCTTLPCFMSGTNVELFCSICVQGRNVL